MRLCVLFREAASGEYCPYSKDMEAVLIFDKGFRKFFEDFVIKYLDKVTGYTHWVYEIPVLEGTF